MAKSVKLSTGADMPIIGLGTWQSSPEQVVAAVEAAIDAGYRHIDTAFAYQNEKSIGQAIKNKISQGKVKREDLFIVTKLHMQYNSKELVKKCLLQSLEALGLDYVDLYLIHGPMKIKLVENSMFPVENGKFPMEPVNHLEVWQAMEEMQKMGLTKSIGLSNFNSKQIERIMKNCTVKPSNLQVECHAYFPQHELHEFCKKNNITFTAYAPLGSPDRSGSKFGSTAENITPMSDEKVNAIAKKYNKTAAQVLLRWLVQRDIIVIPKSVTPERIRQNFQIFDFNLTEDDMKTLNNLGVNKRTFGNSPMVDANSPEYPYHEAF